MLKTVFLSLIVCLSTLFSACKKEEVKYVQARFITGYCPKTGASLVRLEPNSGTENQIALLNLPSDFQVRDKIFLLSYHYDAALDKIEEQKICPAIFTKQTIFVCTSAKEPTL